MVTKSFSLAIEVARELTELTGENTHCIRQWAIHQKLEALLGSLNTFKLRLGTGWSAKCERTVSEKCRLETSPLHCQLRLRVVSLWTQFSQDVKQHKKRQIIIIFGYEECTGLMHFRIYGSGRYEADAAEPVLCKKLAIDVVADFVEECGRMVGLPLQRVMLTQILFAQTSAPSSHVAHRKGNDLRLPMKFRAEVSEAEDKFADGDKAPFVFSTIAKTSQQQVDWFSTFEGDHPFITYCKSTDAKALTEKLSDMVNQHNRLIVGKPHRPRRSTLGAFEIDPAGALKGEVRKKDLRPLLEIARKALFHGDEKVTNPITVKPGSRLWLQPYKPLLKKTPVIPKWMREYVRRPFSLREVFSYERPYETFISQPGDSPSEARRPSDSGDVDTKS